MKKLLCMTLLPVGLCSLGTVFCVNTLSGTCVSTSELKSIIGGACVAIDNGATNVSICSGVCGTKSVRPTKSDADGGSPASQKCGTSVSCTGPYGVTGTCAGE
jgi:hypothetical protein